MIINDKDKIDIAAVMDKSAAVKSELQKLDHGLVYLLCAVLIVVFMSWNWKELYDELKRISYESKG